MKIKKIFYIVGSLLVIVLAVFYVVYSFLPHKKSAAAPSQQTSNTQQAAANSMAKQDPLMWISNNDATGAISYYLKQVPDDSSVDQNLTMLNQDVQNFK